MKKDQITLLGGKPAHKRFKEVMYDNATYFLDRKINKFIV